ncbi:response regulator [Muricomes intestini]|jgi:two-component system response regulator YesN|uniref:response regulator n=1 Tax=Muricomes intestini TaxID=1796634 RepID=UPI002FDDE0C5
MFKLLIADDEQFIRKGIISILKKNLTEEIQCIEAANGQDALMKAREMALNLIITDISMPGCDGLEFIRQLREENKMIPIVILSGYDNFEYAQKAIRLGVKEYIMKPIKKQEFITLIQEYIDDIRKQKARTIQELNRKMENDRIMERLKHDFLLGLLKCPSSVEAERYLIQLKELGMEFESKLYICVVVQYKVREDNQDYMDFAAKNILDEYLNLEAENERIINVTYDKGQIVTIFEGSNLPSLQESKKKLIRKAASLIKRYCKTEVYAGIGDVAYDFIHLHTSLRHALLAANFKLYEHGDNVMAYDEIDKEAEVNSPNLVKQMKPAKNINIFHILEEMQKILDQGENKQVINTLKKEYEDIQEYISLQLIRHQTGKDGELSAYKPLDCCWNFSEVKRELKERIEFLQQFLDKGSQGNTQLSKMILQYVDEHITEELNLNLIADKFYRTPGYISTIFKRHTEGGFNAYLTKERIEIAKRLIGDSSIPIQEISELSGFSNSKYFSVVFKKMTGESPREYRARHIR